MKILILNWRDPDNPKSGGAEKVTMEHARAWIKAGHTVTWFTSHFSNAEKQEVIDGVLIVRKGSAYTVHLLAPFFYFFSGAKFDVVIDEIHGIPFFTPFYIRKPKIAFIHEIAGEIWDYMYPFPFNVLGKFLEKISFVFYKNVSFWTDAPSTLKELKQLGIDSTHAIAIACPITNPVLTKPVKKETNPTFLFVSRVVPMKGVERVLEAFKIIYEKEKTAQLWIIGGGDTHYINKLKMIIKEYGIEKNVVLYGFISDKRKLELMRKAHVLLHASVKEGWGLVVLEAASQGTPAVVYNVSGLRDVVKNNKTGIILNENNPEDMAQEAIKLFYDKKLYKNFQENGLAWAKSITWQDATKKSLQLLSNI